MPTRWPERNDRYRAKLKKDALNAYGNECACCGETEFRFLTLKRTVQDDEAPKYARGGNGLYFWLRKQQYPPEFQTLCMNCNMGGHWNGGVCPHKKPMREPANYQDRFYRAIKIEALSVYGDSKCACCGEDELWFLSLDHIEPIGRKNRPKKGSSGHSFYFYLKKDGWPDKDNLRVLCFNCNSGRAWNGGTCPHEGR